MGQTEQSSKGSHVLQQVRFTALPHLRGFVREIITGRRGDQHVRYRVNVCALLVLWYLGRVLLIFSLLKIYFL